MKEKEHIGTLFDRIAKTYDALNHLLSLNIDRYWRRKTVDKMMPAENVLDVAIGTADLAIEILHRSKAVHVTGIDLSHQMMEIGQDKCKKRDFQVDFIYANAQAMPFDDRTFDAVTCAFGCRNFLNLDEGLREMRRVLKPGGQVTILEFSYPQNTFVRTCYDFYFSRLLPTIGRWVSRDKTAYTYLNRSVKDFCSGDAFVQHLYDAGFSEAHFFACSFGIATIYTAIK